MNNSSEVGLSISSIGMLIVAARRSIRQLIAAKVVPLEITPHHFWMILVLFRGAPMSLGELARAMWMDNPTVSRMVQQMELRGYLTVGPDPTHGRRIRIRLTAEGLSLCERLNQIGGDFEEASHKNMSTEEIAMLRDLLCKYMRNLDVMVASDLVGAQLRPQYNLPKGGENSEPPKASGI